MKLIFFELKKFLFNWKTLILFVIFSVLLLGGTLRHEMTRDEDKMMKRSMLEGLKYNSNSDKELLDEGLEIPKEKREEFSREREFNQNKLEALEANDINKYYDWYHQEINQFLESANNDPLNNMKIKDYEEEKAYIELVKKRGLDFEYNPRWQTHAFGRLSRFFDSLFTGLWILAFAMVLVANFASLFENKEIRLYHAFGVEKAKLIGSKLFSALGGTYLWLILLSSAFLILVGLMKGFGSPNYPAFLEDSPPIPALMNGKVSPQEIRVVNMAISNGEVILISLGYGLFVLFFLATLGMFLSVLTKRSLLVVAIMALLTEGYNYIQYDTLTEPFRKFIPMSYLNPVNLLKYPNYLFGKNSLYFGIIYLLIWGIIFSLASYFMLKKYRLRRI